MTSTVTTQKGSSVVGLDAPAVIGVVAVAVVEAEDVLAAGAVAAAKKEDAAAVTGDGEEVVAASEEAAQSVATTAAAKDTCRASALNRPNKRKTTEFNATIAKKRATCLVTAPNLAKRESLEVGIKVAVAATEVEALTIWNVTTAERRDTCRVTAPRSGKTEEVGEAKATGETSLEDQLSVSTAADDPSRKTAVADITTTNHLSVIIAAGKAIWPVSAPNRRKRTIAVIAAAAEDYKVTLNVTIAAARVTCQESVLSRGKNGAVVMAAAVAEAGVATAVTVVLSSAITAAGKATCPASAPNLGKREAEAAVMAAVVVAVVMAAATSNVTIADSKGTSHVSVLNHVRTAIHKWNAITAGQ
jgi:hypothetical protein